MKTVEAYETNDGQVFKSLTEARVHEEFQTIMPEVEAFMQSDACNYKSKQQQTIIKSAILAWVFWKADGGMNQ
jgi:hypothetical protein